MVVVTQPERLFLWGARDQNPSALAARLVITLVPLSRHPWHSSGGLQTRALRLMCRSHALLSISELAELVLRRKSVDEHIEARK